MDIEDDFYKSLKAKDKKKSVFELVSQIYHPSCQSEFYGQSSCYEMCVQIGKRYQSKY